MGTFTSRMTTALEIAARRPSRIFLPEDVATDQQRLQRFIQEARAVLCS
jgi:hypothetical protein